MQPIEEAAKNDSGLKITSLPVVVEKDTMQYKPVKKKIDWRFVSMAIITGISFVLLLSYTVFVDNIAPLIFAGSTAKASEVKSMVFAYPLSIENTLGISTVQVFLVDEEGKPIPFKDVTLTASFGYVTPVSVKTDITGTATFSYSSSTSGVAELRPFTDNRKLAQSVTVKVLEN